MRLYPPVPGIGRAIKETRQFGEFEVRKGTQIFVMQYLVHRDQRYFDDPDEFRVPPHGGPIPYDWAREDG